MSLTPEKSLLISELRVFELKQELEKRGLDKVGVKLTLIERLETALRDEGHDPKTYKFTVADCNKSAAAQVKESPQSSSVKQEETGADQESNDLVIEVEEQEDLGNCEKMEDEVKEDLEVKDDDIGGMKMENEDAGKESDDGENKVDETMEISESMLSEEKEEIVTAGDIDMKNDEECNSEKMENVAVANEKRPEENEVAAENVDSKTLNLSENVDSCRNGEPFASSAETVTSTPAERNAATSSLQANVVKKSDNSLWIKNVSPNTKAADLKALFSKHGRVLTAKIFTRRQQPANTCFGFVTMVDSATADLCIQKLHKTTLKGRIITVERADRSNMPTIRPASKKSGNSASASEIKSTKSVADITSKTAEDKRSTKTQEKTRKEVSANSERSKTGAATHEKASSNTEKVAISSATEKQTKTSKSGDVKRSPVKPPSDVGSPCLSDHRSKHGPPVYRGGRRIDKTLVSHRPVGIRKASYMSAAIRRPYAGSHRGALSSRRGRGGHLMSHREISSRRVEASSWEKRNMLEILRKKEEEHRLKEEELRLQRERERLRFERERFERERLELQQLRQIAALAAPVQHLVAATPVSSHRSHDSYDMDTSRNRSERSRHLPERSSSHRRTTGSASVSDRHESRSASHHVLSTHSSSRDTTRLRDRERERERDRERERERERERDRSKHSSRDYGSTVSGRDSGVYSREPHAYGRTDANVTSSSYKGYGRDSYKADTAYSGHRSESYSSRDVGNYGSTSTYARDIAPSTYPKDGGYSSSRSLSGNASWPTAYGGSSRDYESSGNAWMQVSGSSQSHGSHGVGSSNWSRAEDQWAGSDIQGTRGYDKYDKYETYAKYSRRY